MIETISASAVILAVGVLVLWWARECRRGTLPRNWIFGYRTKLTLSDDQAWVVVNRASAPFIAIAGFGLIVAAIVGIIAALVGASAVASALIGSSIVWLLGWVLIGIIPAARAARKYQETSRTA
ncbi:hypothetical protein ASE14_07825 [Agromyces sp. Root81]|uniref:SdpI family protein n=1 Tax=Agromyces sp. Root81 TaxID=1736601 RepID=UPI0006FB0FFA|nr:SdpI family protein [Agromyces sp. Root81]KRC60864.1 hypothetical protein ASE14_07825 [Agromyces sp. Root81]